MALSVSSSFSSDRDLVASATGLAELAKLARGLNLHGGATEDGAAVAALQEGLRRPEVLARFRALGLHADSLAAIGRFGAGGFEDFGEGGLVSHLRQAQRLAQRGEGRVEHPLFHWIGGTAGLPLPNPLRERLLMQLQHPEGRPFDADDLHIRIGILESYHRLAEEGLHRGEDQGGVLEGPFHRNIRGLEAELCYIWPSGFERPARDLGLGSLADRAAALSQSGIKLGEQLKTAVARTDVVTEYRRLAGEVTREGSPVAVAGIVELLPQLFELRQGLVGDLREGKLAEFEAPRRTAREKALRGLIAEVDGWPQHFKGREKLAESFAEVEPGQIRPEQIPFVAGMQEALAGHLKDKSYEAWLAAQPEGRRVPKPDVKGATIGEILTDFIGDQAVRRLSDRQRLEVIHLAARIAEAGAAQPAMTKRLPVPTPSLYTTVREAPHGTVGLRVLSDHLIPEAERPAFGASFDSLLGGERGSFEGPIASLLASTLGRGGRWAQLFGLEELGDSHEIWAVIGENGTREVSRLFLYEGGQPRAAILPLWRRGPTGEVPIQVRFLLSPTNEHGSSLETTLFDLQGGESRVAPVALKEEEGQLVTHSLFAGDSAEVTVGLFTYHGRRTLAVQGRDGGVLGLATPNYPNGLGVGDGRSFEDLAGIAPHLPDSFGSAVESVMRGIFRRVAEQPVDSPARRTFADIVEASPFPTRGRIGRYLLDPKLTPAERNLAAEMTFGRTYAGWGDVHRVAQLTDSSWAAHVQNRRTGHEFIAFLFVRGDASGFEEAFGQAVTEVTRLASSGQGWPRGSDLVVDLMVPSISLLGQRVIGVALEGEGKGRAVVTQSLERLVNAVLASKTARRFARRVWRVTVEENRGETARSDFWTFRNRRRYDAEPARAGYRIALPGKAPFAHDPALEGAHPLTASTRYGLDRLGNFQSIEVVPPFDPTVGRVLLLQGTETSHYFLASVVPAEEVVVTGDGEIPALTEAHRTLVTELVRQQNDRTRWPDPAKSPQWNRLRLRLHGVSQMSPAEFERLMPIFANRTVGEREGLSVERAVVEAPLQFRLGDRYHQVTALATLEDVGEVSEVQVRYFVRARGEKITGEQEVLVGRGVLERILTTGDNTVREGEWKSADEKIRDKTEVDRRKAVAKAVGGTFIYDRVQTHVREAAANLWQAAGRTPPDDPLTDVEEIYVEEERFRVAKREPGKNSSGVVAFKVRVRLPSYPDGRDVVYIGNDPTPRESPLGALSYDGALVYFLAAEYARQNKLPLIYDAWTSGAKMGLPEQITPKRPGMPLRVEWDSKTKKAYLTRAQVGEVVGAMKAARWEDLFVGTWEGDRFYPTSLLQGGVNQKSLLGSGLTGGAMARAAATIPTIALVLGGKGRGRSRVGATGIGMYDYRLARTGRGQNSESYVNLTGADAANNMYRVRLFRDQMDLGGAGRMEREGMTTFTFGSEIEGLTAALKLLNDPANDTISPIAERREFPVLAGLVRGQAPTTDPLERDIGPAIMASQTRIAGIKKDKRIPYGVGHYDTADELAAIFDVGSLQLVPGTPHHALFGAAQLGGWPVAVVGAQMLAQIGLDEKGKIRLTEVDAFDPQGKPIRMKVPDVNPAMTLTPAAAGALATFIENVPAGMPIVGDLGAAGYDPRFVAASGENGARLLSAIALHQGPVLLWVGPGKKVLGGMEVTVAPTLGATVKVTLGDGVEIDLGRLDQFADLGHIKNFADPSSFMAVLDPTGWRGIKFYKDTVAYITGVLQQERGMEPAQASEAAEGIVAQVVGWMSSLDRANADGAFTGIVGTKGIRQTLATEVDAWYSKSR